MNQPSEGGLRLLVDANVPFAEEAFSSFGHVEQLPGAAFTPERVKEADVLLVRSVTRVDARLLEGSPVRFVGTATIGTDHVDEAWLRKQGIGFASAPGSNAESVVEYVLAALLALAARREGTLRGRVVGVVGAGNVGARLVPRLEALGARVLVCDPPRQRREGGPFVPLDTLLDEADIVSLHTPLTHTGPDATHHLVNGAALGKMRRGAWLINAARGAVVDGPALLQALEGGSLGAAALDVWEGEPAPDPALVARVDVATPHIAGYSFDGKVQGTVDLVHALERWTGRPSEWDAARARAPLPADALLLRAPDPGLPEPRYLHELARQMYDLMADDSRMRALLGRAPEARAEGFRDLRRDYPRRRRWGLFSLAGPVPEAYREAVGKGLGIQMEGEERSR